MATRENKIFQVECKRLLNKEDPLDRLILDLAKTKELDVNFVDTESNALVDSDKYSVRGVPKLRGKHSA
jgi:hypothetical protein